MMHQPPYGAAMRRRTFLRSLAAGGLSILVAACSLSRKKSTPPSPTASQAAQSGGTPTAGVSGVAPIPQPLPTPGGVPPTVVGAAAPPAAPATPNAGSAANLGVVGTPVVSPSGPPTNPGTPAAAVTITLTPDFKFSPNQVTISTGQTVGWKNLGRSPQTVTDDPTQATNTSDAALPASAKPFNSGVLNYNAIFSHTFDVAGDYVYFSVPSESRGMVGKVTVQ